MKKFADLVKSQARGAAVTVLDIGSAGVNGTYKELFQFPGAAYTGLDIAPGPNVDIVLADPYRWSEIPDLSFDVVISGQTLEHVEYPWLVMEQIRNKLKWHGLACLIVPSRGPVHRYPVDCYRYHPDGLRALAKWSGLTVLETGLAPQTSGFGESSDQWGDCHCVLTKRRGDTAAQPHHRAPAPVMTPAFLHKHNPLRQEQGEFYYLQARNDVLPHIVNSGITARRVLELGCSSGATGEHLKAQLAVEHYVGIEKFADAAQLARAHLDEVFNADIEATPPAALGLKENDFDLVVALDVLEHLHDPWETLARLTALVRPGGHVVLSLPNVQNITILQGLSNGRWTYEGSGLLDSTHLRFFTKASIDQLIEGAGLTTVGMALTLNSALDAAALRDTGNSFSTGPLTLTNLTRDEALRLLTYIYETFPRNPQRLVGGAAGSG